jgi:AraC family transcriptional regulator of adaptative response/methylated-DNA-[protein]-cysteine methyltransferase
VHVGRDLDLRFLMTTRPRGPLLLDWCETPYGYACITCSSKGLRSLDIFEHRQHVEHYLQSHSIRSLEEPTQETTLLGDMVLRSLRAISRPSDLESIPLDLYGTPFQLAVWRHLQSIPWGEVRSYTEVACAMQIPRAVRAVANACARNRIGLVIPCHRVVRSNGLLGGYRWGGRVKELVLEYERKATTQNSCLLDSRPIA